MADSDTDTATVDIDGLTDKIGEKMFGPSDDTPETVEPEAPETTPDQADAPTDTSTVASSDKTPPPTSPGGPVAGATVAPPKETAPPAPVMDEAPKAWPKTMHEHWGKLDPAVKEYLKTREHQMLEGLSQYKDNAEFGRTFKEIVTPYIPHFKAAGIEPDRLVAGLLNANWMLTTGPMENRKAAYEKLGKDLGFTVAPVDPNAPPPNPEVQALQREIENLKTGLTARQQADYQQAAEVTAKEVDTFASDTVAHPYFEDVADDIVALLRAYPKLSLQDAYDRAVFANPVTRAKEVAAKEQAAIDKFVENKRLDALPKKKAANANVRSRETERAPTEPLGTIEDTVRDLLRSRTTTH